MEFREITDATEVTTEMVEAAVEIADGFFADEPIDWDALLDRLANWTGAEFSELDSPPLRKLQRLVREARREG